MLFLRFMTTVAPDVVTRRRQRADSETVTGEAAGPEADPGGAGPPRRSERLKFLSPWRSESESFQLRNSVAGSDRLRLTGTGGSPLAGTDRPGPRLVIP